MIQTAAEVADQFAEAVSQTTPLMRAQVGAAAVVATTALLPVAWLGVRRLVPARNVVFARWGFSHVAIAIGILFATGLVLALLPIDLDDLGVLLAVNCATFGLVVAAIAVWAARLDPDGVRVLGLRASGTGRAIAAGAIAYVAVFPAIAGSIHVWNWVLERFGHVAEPQEIAARFAALPADERLLPMFLGVVVQPLFEEVIFRSFLQPLLVQNFREVMGVGITSLVFASLHGVDALLPIFLLSCVLGAVMLRTQSLYAVWAIHALNNGLQFAVLYAYPESVGGAQGS